MKKRLLAIILSITCAFSMTACGSDPVVKKFANDIDTFCESIAKIDKSINEIDAESESAVSEMLEYMDELDEEFVRFKDMDFPTEYDYLESLADEASSYMTEAVTNYHEAFSNDSYNDYTADYAYENYARAFKRVSIIVSFLHGIEPDSVQTSEE